MQNRSIYLDFNATTDLDPAVLEKMHRAMVEFQGNPSSVHHVGRRARAALDEARYEVSNLWSCKPSEVVFTSGGTESNNLAIFGTARALQYKGKHLITSVVEHHATLDCFTQLERREGFTVTYLPVNSKGSVDPEQLFDCITPETVLVSIMAANNEVGTIEPISEIGKECRARGVIFHTDAVQWFGKLPVSDIHQFEADLVSVCGHKFHGPKGAGALYIKSPLQPISLLVGGGQENERRAGTENLPAILGFTDALTRFTKVPVFPATSLKEMRRPLETCLDSLEGVQVWSDPILGLPNTVALSVAGTDSFALLAALDLEGICASGGAACSAGSLEPSHVLLGMGATHAQSRALLRFSLGRNTTPEQISYLTSLLPQIIHRIRNP